MTYAGYSFEAILNQVMDGLGYDWQYAYEEPTLTTAGFQAKLFATKKGDPPTTRPPLNVLSAPCARKCEAYESVLFRTLLFIDEIIGYKIGDLHFSELVVLGR